MTAKQLLQTGPTAEQIAAATAQVAQADAALQVARVALAQTELYAPFAGTISDLPASPGETVQPGQIVLSLADLSDLQAETDDLSERDVDHIAIGQKATVWVEALGEEIEGQVIAIAPQATTSGGDVVYAVKVELDEQLPGLRWGMSVDVETVSSPLSKPRSRSTTSSDATKWIAAQAQPSVPLEFPSTVFQRYGLARSEDYAGFAENAILGLRFRPTNLVRTTRNGMKVYN